MNLVDEQNAHRAAVEAGYASLPGYLEKWPQGMAGKYRADYSRLSPAEIAQQDAELTELHANSASQVSEWVRNHVAIAERHAAAGPRWIDDVPPTTETCGECGRRLL